MSIAVGPEIQCMVKLKKLSMSLNLTTIYMYKICMYIFTCIFQHCWIKDRLFPNQYITTPIQIDMQARSKWNIFTICLTFHTPHTKQTKIAHICTNSFASIYFWTEGSLFPSTQQGNWTFVWKSALILLNTSRSAKTVAVY